MTNQLTDTYSSVNTQLKCQNTTKNLNVDNTQHLSPKHELHLPKTLLYVFKS